MTAQKFRALIALHLALTLAGIGASFLPNSISPELSEAYANEPLPSFVGNEWFWITVALTLLAIWIAGMVGLWQFKRWGRAVSLYATIAAIIVVAFFGPTLSTGIESAMYEAASLCWGAVLALAYYSSIRERFDETDS